MPRLIDRRDQFNPFLYPQAFDFYKRQREGRWEPEDIEYTADVMQWPDIDPDIKRIVAGVLRGFVQAEILVAEYWSQNVARWFPHSEIGLMCLCFGDIEGVHARSYNQLSETLGLETYEAFKTDPTACAKINYLSNTPNETLQEKARSLAVFSGFTEGVALFSSFAILQWLKSQRLLPGVTSVIDYSVRDESTHSEAGCWLFRTFLEEQPELNTPELWSQVLEAAHAIIKLEHSFIDSVFEGRSLPGLDPTDLKEFIKFRTDSKLKELGSKDRIPYDQKASARISSWFDLYNQGTGITDFFAKRSSNYTLGVFHVTKAALSFA